MSTRRGIGTPTVVRSARVGVRQSLIDSVLGAPEPLKRGPERVFRGPKARVLAPTELSAAVVRKVRALREFWGWSERRIGEALGMPEHRARAIVEYRMLPNEVPSRDDLVGMTNERAGRTK